MLSKLTNTCVFKEIYLNNADFQAKVQGKTEMRAVLLAFQQGV